MTKLITVVCREDECVGDVAAPPVPWWSVTKTCLAACALVLVERGRLTLDDPLPDRPYTLRHLLAHTSGLGSYTARPEYHAAIERHETPWPDADLFRRLRFDPFVFAPGQGWSYSNTGYFLVRHLIEQAMNAPIGAALQELVFAPLGIERSRIALDLSDLDRCAWGNDSRYHPGWVFHGLVIGPPVDAVRFMHRLMGGDLLPPALHAAMRERRALDVPLDKRPWREPGYGLGLMMPSGSASGPALGHTGQGPDSTAAVFHFPELVPPCTAGAFAPTEDVSVVEGAVIDLARGRDG
jgi:D-alanyl-D-alanine carboxypeptidase